MKTFHFLFVGVAKNSAYKELENHYLKKIGFYVRSVRVDYIKDSANSDLIKRNQKEGEDFFKKVPSQALLILCDEKGSAQDSVTFSKNLRRWHEDYDEIVFGVGGAYGFSNEVKAKAKSLITLSPFTLPHELARVVLLEQVYRGMSLLKGEKYHHGD